MRTDTVFPQLALALDPDYMVRALQNMFAHYLRIEACSVDEVRHKPGKRCLLSYRLAVRDKTSGRPFAQIVSGRLLRADEPPSLASPGATAVLTQPAMLVWLFPVDSRLPDLPRLFDRHWLARQLSVALQPLGFDPSDRISDIDVETVHYIPQRSCIVRCAFDWWRADGTRISRPVLFAKQYADGSGAATFSVMSQLRSQWHYGARPLHYDDGSRTLWQCRRPGLVLTWERLLSGDWQTLIEHIADCVITLHRSVLYCERSFGIAQIVGQLDEAVALARELDTAIAGRTQRLVRRLLEQRNRLPSQPVPATSGPLHRDLKLINFLYDDNTGRLSLIDMDCVESGDPVIDLASLVANLYLNGLRAAADDTAIEPIEPIVAYLLAAYTKRTAIPPTHLRWHIAAAMVYQVLRRSIRQRNARRLRHVAAYLCIGERYCRENEHDHDA
jgi:hypothetical protein